MDSSPIDSHDDQTFHLIRLPRETVELAKNGGSKKVGTLYVYDDSRSEFIDDNSHKVYSLVRNTPIKGEGGTRKHSNNVAASEESDLFRISLQKKEAVHLGKVKLSTLLAVPKADEKDVSTAYG